MPDADPDAGDAVVRLRVRWDPDADADEVDRLGRQLRSALQDLDVEEVAAAPGGAAPDGSKGVDVGALSELLVTMSATGGVFASVVATVRSWLAHRDGASAVTVTIGGDTLELARATAQERSELVRAFVETHQRT